MYHSFHEEVDNYRQHWWRCGGSCQKRPPYFGYVKRAMNRAPSARDPWWAEHQNTCGGSYVKIKEPEGYGEKKKKKQPESRFTTNNTFTILIMLQIILIEYSQSHFLIAYYKKFKTKTISFPSRMLHKIIFDTLIISF